MWVCFALGLFGWVCEFPSRCRCVDFVGEFLCSGLNSGGCGFVHYWILRRFVLIYIVLWGIARFDCGFVGLELRLGCLIG